MSFWNKLEKPSDDAAPAPVAPAEPARPAPVAATPPAPPAAPAARPEPAPAAPVARAAPVAPGDTKLGRGVKLEGKLSFSGTVRIEATFEGSIVTDGVLVVGDGAKVKAEITAGTVVVEGEVNGDVVASAAVEVKASGRLRGDVETPTFAIERGALFEGSSRRPGGTASSDRRAGKAAAAPAQHH